MELCGPHIAIFHVMLRSSNARGAARKQAAGDGDSDTALLEARAHVAAFLAKANLDEEMFWSFNESVRQVKMKKAVKRAKLGQVFS